ncbi:Cadmium, zinc and cobalt-transporting ATPase [bioreactor metagenome]|uniref:Cadmium, zinc and cobalt-transporting ATPase n=1 Tax=bioreactor metagenome TaxID=1076179 RepID=A0A644Z2L2_9ZZZZ|nr:heavy metal translocating P-type ATPase [Erysipelotrichaceae bacterium]
MKLSTNQRRLCRIIIAAVLYLPGVLLEKRHADLALIFLLAGFLTAGSDIIIKAVKKIMIGQWFDESFLMSIATIGALAISRYDEAVAVMLFYQIGELLQSYAVNKSRRSIAALMDIRPDYANVIRNDRLLKVDPEAVMVQETIMIKPGEKIPLDVLVIEGNSTIDTSALTGESLPREVTIGDRLLSGCININGLLTARVEKEFSESTVSKILDLVENASSKKAAAENFITKFAHYYTPFVVLAAILLAVVPTILLPDAVFSEWLYRALLFLVISCPCALVISVPMSFFGGIGGASRKGILIKGGNYLETLTKVDTVVFDKTGTLTKGVFKVQRIVAKGISESRLLELAALVESYSNHPISQSLKAAYGMPLDQTYIKKIEELAGQGISAEIDGRRILVGNDKLMKRYQVTCTDTSEITGTVIHVASDDDYLGYIQIADELKPDAKQTIRALKQQGIKTTGLLTGDTRKIGDLVGKELAIDQIYTELLPGEKVTIIEKMMSELSNGAKLAFVGDGINDAPVLARADVGIAMGGLGSDAAIEAADIVIMTDEPLKVATAVRIARKTMLIVKENIIFALSVKAIVMVLGAAGIGTMWSAVFADVGVTVLAVLNAARALSVKKI